MHLDIQHFQAFTQMVKNSLVSYLRRQCACDLDNDDIYNVELDCRSGYRVYNELFINYTNEDGEISASTLAQALSLGRPPRLISGSALPRAQLVL